MTSLNSSGSQERFTLAPGESKVFYTEKGANHLALDIKGDDQAAASVTVLLEKSEDNSSWSTVATKVVVPNGECYTDGEVGKYARVHNSSGNDIVHVVAKLRNIAQVSPAL